MSDLNICPRLSGFLPRAPNYMKRKRKDVDFEPAYLSRIDG